MPRGYGRLDVRQVPPAVIERACCDPANLRVGATNDPLARARQYEQQGANGTFMVGTFLYCQARNARQAEQRLLNISRHHGRGYLNRQRNSNYQDYPGYVYVVVGRILDLRTGRLVHPGMPPPQECCAIM